MHCTLSRIIFIVLYCLYLFTRSRAKRARNATHTARIYGYVCTEIACKLDARKSIKITVPNISMQIKITAFIWTYRRNVYGVICVKKKYFWPVCVAVRWSAMSPVIRDNIPPSGQQFSIEICTARVWAVVNLVIVAVKMMTVIDIILAVDWLVCRTLPIHVTWMRHYKRWAIHRHWHGIFWNVAMWLRLQMKWFKFLVNVRPDWPEVFIGWWKICGVAVNEVMVTLFHYSDVMTNEWIFFCCIV